MRAGSLSPAPVWSDLRTFDARPWRRRVDLVAGGTPCQELSLAGSRNGRPGLDGKRSGLFFDFCRVVEHVEPLALFWENVGGARSALPRVFAEFERIGYSGAALEVRASDVGATHRRSRIFTLAYRDDARLERRERFHRRHADERTTGEVRRPMEWPPRPDELEQWERVVAERPDLAPALTRFRGMADGVAPGVESAIWADRLRLLGNGVVPKQAAFAFRFLSSHLA